MNGNKKEYHNGSLTIEEKEQNIYAVENENKQLSKHTIIDGYIVNENSTAHDTQLIINLLK